MARRHRRNDVGVPANSLLNSINSGSAVAPGVDQPAVPSVAVKLPPFLQLPGQLASYLGVYNGGRTRKVMWPSHQRRAAIICRGSSLVAGSWYHVVASYDGAAPTST
jgi:hypothetical protein